MKTPKILIAALALTTLAACGKAPSLPSTDTLTIASNNDPEAPVNPDATEPLPSPTPSASPSPGAPQVTTTYFIATNLLVCNALAAWNPQTQTIIMGTNVNGGYATYYQFDSTGVKYVTTTGMNPHPTVSITKKDAGNTVYCTIRISSGQLTGLQ